MAKIESVHAREVFDSRGRPTVEVEVRCAGARAGRAIVPSGASTGQFEAVERRDGDVNRLAGRGVTLAVAAVNTEIATALRGHDANDQNDIDNLLCALDATPNKSRLGANAILGTSLACAYAAAEAQDISSIEHLHDIWHRVPTSDVPRRFKIEPELGADPQLPLPMVNMISGGLHAGGNLDIQDVLAVPVGATSFRQGFDWIVSVYYELSGLLRDGGFEGILVGDEGGFGPRLSSNEAAIEYVVRAIEAAGLRPGVDVSIALDVASSSFFDGGQYRLRTGRDAKLSSQEMADLVCGWIDRYPIVSVEDPLAEEDWVGWPKLTERIGDRVQLIGDDLFVTNAQRLRQGLARGVANSVLIKVNQVGTLWETLETMRLALDAGYRPVVSARSGETEDVTIADLAVATGAGQIKIGSVARSERLAKYNQLLRWEERLGDRAGYAGTFLNLRRNSP